MTTTPALSTTPAAGKELLRAKTHRLEPQRFGLAEHLRHDVVVVIEQGVSIEDLQTEHYWSPVASRLTPWDRIEARWEDGTQWAELLVLSCGRNWARMKVLRHEKLASAEVEQTQAAASDAAGPTMAVTYGYRYRGKIKQHSIVRSDGEVMFEGGQTKDDAFAFAKAHGYALT